MNTCRLLRHAALFQYAASGILAFGVLSAAATSACAAPAWQEEQELDRQVGILQHPWKINVVNLRTRDDLRAGAQVATGLQPFDQQAERAQQSPPSLWNRLTAPTDAEESEGSDGDETPTRPDNPLGTPPGDPTRGSAR